MRSNNAIASLLPGRRLDTARVRQTGVLPDGSGAGGASAFWASAWNVALVALPAATIFVLGYMRRHVTDDALIYCRTVRQILAGNGPVFNVGERAEASTSSLWQWLLALADWATGINVEQLAVFGGLLLTTAGFVVALVATRRFQRERLGRNCALIPGGILLLLALPPVWDYATTGLESGLQTFWLASCWWLLVRSHSTARLRPGIASLVIIGLGPLVRPELSLVSLVFVVAILVNLRASVRMANLRHTACQLTADWIRDLPRWVLRPACSIARSCQGSRGSRPIAWLCVSVGFCRAVLVGSAASRSWRAARSPNAAAQSSGGPTVKPQRHCDSCCACF